MQADLEGAFPRDRKLHDRTSLIALLIGVRLLWPLPLGGVLLMVAATFALVISWEEELSLPRSPLTPPPLEGNAMRRSKSYSSE